MGYKGLLNSSNFSKIFLENWKKMEEEIKCEIEQFRNQGETFSITSEELTNFKNTRYFNIPD